MIHLIIPEQYARADRAALCGETEINIGQNAVPIRRGQNILKEHLTFCPECEESSAYAMWYLGNLE